MKPRPLSGLALVMMLALVKAPGIALAQVEAVSPPDTSNDAVALVDGHPLSRAELVDILMDARGVEVLQQMVVRQLAKEEVRARGLRVTRVEIEREFQQALDTIAKEAGMDPDEATHENKLEALRQVLAERGLSESEFRIGMERNAYLRACVETELVITEETLRAQFGRMYGERVRIRHIQIAQHDRQGLNEALEMLRRGTDFEDVARRFSKNEETAARGGLMPEFTFSDPRIPAAIRETAFSLKEGAVSNPVLAGQFFHLLRLEVRIPPEHVRLEDVRDEVSASVREAALPQAMAKLARELFEKARIRVLDSKLRPKYQEYLDQSAASPAAP